uniref:Uncharacterized protein n=1 Tax=Rhizophora mucronata TaxID=61149 RepID=A0A2P2QIP1_RHIMU
MRSANLLIVKSIDIFNQQTALNKRNLKFS